MIWWAFSALTIFASVVIRICPPLSIMACSKKKGKEGRGGGRRKKREKGKDPARLMVIVAKVFLFELHVVRRTPRKKKGGGRKGGGRERGKEKAPQRRTACFWNARNPLSWPSSSRCRVHYYRRRWRKRGGGGDEGERKEVDRNLAQ